MIILTVFFEGEQYYKVGDSLALVELNDGALGVIHFVALNKIEPAHSKSVSRVVWIDANKVEWIKTQTDFQNSEWIIGASSGNE